MCEKPYTRTDLDGLLKDLLDITELPFQIKRQIRDYIERGYTYKGIARALCFLVDVKKFNLRASYQQYGIGIVKNIYAEAQTYFEKLRIEKEKQLKKQQEIIATTTTTVVIQCGTGDSKKHKKRNSIDISSL